MVSLRRAADEPRVEIMPLIDVIFLLLTFFIYSMVMMIRAELLPMELQSFQAGTPAEPAPAASISIMLDGSIAFNREPTAVNEIADRVRLAVAQDPETMLYLALEDGEGTMDRGPILTSIMDALKNTGVDINFVGRPSN